MSASHLNLIAPSRFIYATHPSPQLVSLILSPTRYFLLSPSMTTQDIHTYTHTYTYLNSFFSGFKNSTRKYKNKILKKSLMEKFIFFVMFIVKIAGMGSRYFARRRFSRSLIHKENISLITASSPRVWILILSKVVGYPFCINSCCEWQLFSLILLTSHFLTHIDLQFRENVFHWSKFKTCLTFIFFWWTFHLLLIDPNRCFLFEA